MAEEGHVDPDITGEFILNKLKELDPALLIQHLRQGIQEEALVAIANATQISVADEDGETPPAPATKPRTIISQGEIVLLDADGNTRTITATSDVVNP